eukprot:g41694.t1
MLHNILFTTTSGLVLFSKAFLKGKLPTQLAGLVTAMVEFSTRRAGLPVSYIQLTNTAVAITTDAAAKVTCAVIHGAEDGPNVGGLLARELLQAFVGHYWRRFPLESKVAVEERFQDFGSKITDVIKNAVGPVLRQLRARQEVETCLLIHGDSLQFATDPVDKLGLLANHEALTAASHDLLHRRQESATQCYLVSGDSTTLIQRYAAHRASFIVKYRTQSPRKRLSHADATSSGALTDVSSPSLPGTALPEGGADGQQPQPPSPRSARRGSSPVDESPVLSPSAAPPGLSITVPAKEPPPPPADPSPSEPLKANHELVAAATAAAALKPDLQAEIQNTARLIETLLIMVSNLQLQETAQLLDIR